MSQDELVRGIRRIVGEQEERPTGLADADARKAIGISRGVGLVRSDGSVAGSGAEGGGNDSSPPDVQVEQPTDGADLPGDAGGDNAGPDGGNKTVLSGDAADVDDATTSNSQITNVTGTDPTSSNITSVNFNSLEGIEYTPPNGWDDPDVIPSVTDWVQGQYIRDLTSSVVSASLSIHVYNYNTLFPDPQDPPTGGPWYFDGWGTNPTTLHMTKMWRLVSDDSLNEVDDTRYFIETCENLYNASVCEITSAPADPTITGHPSDGVCSVVYDHSEGGYKGHDLDPDCSTAQKTAADFVIIRSQTDDTRYFRYTRLSDGGTKVTTVDSGGVPVPGSVTKILDGDGNAVGFVDVALDPQYQ